MHYVAVDGKEIQNSNKEYVGGVSIAPNKGCGEETASRATFAPLPLSFSRSHLGETRSKQQRRQNFWPNRWPAKTGTSQKWNDAPDAGPIRKAKTHAMEVRTRTAHSLPSSLKRRRSTYNREGTRTTCLWSIAILAQPYTYTHMRK